MHIFENGMRGSKMWRMYIVCTGSFLPILVGIGPTPIPSLVVIHQKPNPWAEIDGCCSTISLAIKIMIILCHFFQRREECGWSIKHLSCNDQVSLWFHSICAIRWSSGLDLEMWNLCFTYISYFFVCLGNNRAVQRGSRHWCGGQAKGETPTQCREPLWTLLISSITFGRWEFTFIIQDYF